MKFNYEEANEFYTILTCRYDLTVEDELVNKLAGAINLVDECDATEQDKCIMIHSDDDSVLATIKYDPCWPDFLVEQVEDGAVKINSAYRDFVTVEMKYPS